MGRGYDNRAEFTIATVYTLYLQGLLGSCMDVVNSISVPRGLVGFSFLV